LGIAFSVVIAILLAIGQLSLHRMQIIDQTLVDITVHKSIGLQLARALMLSNDNNRIVMEIVLVENRRLVEPLTAARSQNSKEITKLIEESESHYGSEKENQLLTEVKRTRQAYRESCQRAIHLLINERKRDQAEMVLVNETLPALHIYHTAWERFVEFQAEALNLAVKQAQVDYANARHLVSLSIGLAVVLAIVIAVFATRETGHELVTSIDAEKEVSELTVGPEQRVMQRTSELTEAIKHQHLQAAALEAAANAIMITDVSGTITWVNQAFTGMTGYSKEEVLGASSRLLKSGDQPEAYYARLWSTILSGKVWQGEIVNRRKDGTTYTEEMTITPVNQGIGNPADRYFVAIKQDITERKQIEQALWQAEERYRTFFQDAVVGIFQSTPEGRYSNVNPAMARMLGYDSPQELVASITDISRQVYVDPTRREELARLLREQGLVKNFECAVYRKDGSKMWLAANLRAVSEDGVLVGYEGTNEDITARKAAEERIQFLAYYDGLTGLPNRTLLQDRLDNALAAARRQKCKIALLFLDLDGFRIINESRGRAVGDLLLQEVAERLRNWGREQDTVARLGGDEFLVMLSQVNELHDVAVAAERLTDVMTAEFVVQGHSLHIRCSIGVSIFPEHGADCETLIKNADAAMYSAKMSSAKRDGRNNFRFFTDDMNTPAVERLILENGLRLALGKKELFLVYQPQVDVATGRVTGLEALLRWQHPDLGLVPPDNFIQIAENSGLIVPIGEWVLRAACAQARKWQEEGLPAVTIAVNVSAVQFRQEGFCEVIRKVLRETGLAPRYLELELTESLLLTNADMTLSVVRELKAMGLTLAIDDFGTGYSNFASLREFGVSKLKIDRSFIRDVAVKPDDAAITSAIISMAKSLNLKVIAEGVENEAQMSFLRALRCDEIQGYYFSTPLTVDEVADKLCGHSPETLARAQARGTQS
jgi:diguanylate cyclase (GGDEF)-like protein/PAS domain S-box-containing protein